MSASTPNNGDRDIPVEIIGYVTDPKLVGYQILTNYESTYWRCLVGRDVWALYEVLRSFCHEGNDTCNPSIKLLMNILGITDRRQLTGRVTTTRGKERVLPGLIDTLQDYKLAIAEVKGEGPLLRYVFHVNLTPPPLSAEQLKALPKRLQRKHDTLLERVVRDVQKLDKIDRKKPKKKRKRKTDEAKPETPSEFSGSSNIFSEGGGTLPPPPGTVPGPPGTVPPKQYPYNNTQTTTVVVRKLEKKEIDSEKAQELAENYALEYIEEKIEFLEWKLELQESGRQRRGRPITDPAGWLIRAIEKDYMPPTAFFEHKKHEEETARSAEEWEEQQQITELERLQQDGRLARLMEKYETSQREVDLWKQALHELALQMPKATFESWLASTHLLTLDDGKAVICVSNQTAQGWVEHRLAEKIKRTLEGIVEDKSIELEVLVIDAEQTGSSAGGSEETSES